MADCKHVCCGAAEKVWLPYELEGRSRGLKPHSYCIHCGVARKQKINYGHRLTQTFLQAKTFTKKCLRYLFASKKVYQNIDTSRMEIIDRRKERRRWVKIR